MAGDTVINVEHDKREHDKRGHDKMPLDFYKMAKLDEHVEKDYMNLDGQTQKKNKQKDKENSKEITIIVESNMNPIRKLVAGTLPALRRPNKVDDSKLEV